MTELQYEEDCIRPFAHYGYIYCLLLAKSNERDVLVSGCAFWCPSSQAVKIPPTDVALHTAGDEQVKLWEMSQHSLKEVAALESSSDAVLALASRDNTLFAGHQGGVIKVSSAFI